MSEPKPWFASWPVLVTASVVALGSVGTLMVKGAAYITLPERVEAGEQVNAKQDETLTELRTINKTWQEIYQQQTANAPAPRRSRGLREWEDATETMWCCPWDDRDQCFHDHAWRVCN